LILLGLKINHDSYGCQFHTDVLMKTTSPSIYV